MKRMIACLLIGLLAWPCVAVAAQPEVAPGARILLVEGGLERPANKERRIDDEALLLAAIPAANVTDLWYYDKNYAAACTLSGTLSTTERIAALAAWSEGIASNANSRKSTHAKALAAVLAGLQARGEALAGASLQWVARTDVPAAEQAALADQLSLLLGYGMAVQVTPVGVLPGLSAVLDRFPAIGRSPVAALSQSLLSASLAQAGYLAVAEPALSGALSGAQLSSQALVPGELIALELHASDFAQTPLLRRLGGSAIAVLGADDRLPLHGGQIAWTEQPIGTESGSLTANTEGGATPDGAATTLDTPAAQGVTASADANASPDSAAESAGADSMQAVAAADVAAQGSDADEQTVDTPLAENAAIAETVAEPEMLLFIKPAATLGITLRCDPATLASGSDMPTVQATLAATDAFTTGLLSAGLSDTPFTVQAALLPAEGDALPAQIVAAQGDAYAIRLPDAAPGSYTLRLILSLAPMGLDYAYTLQTPLALAAPIPAGLLAAGQDVRLTLALSPLLWHSEHSMMSLNPGRLFSGDYAPVQAHSNAPDTVAVATAADGSLTLQALKPGEATLVLESHDGKAVVPITVRVLNGTARVALETGLAVLGLLMLLGVWLLLRATQPRFRQGEAVCLRWKSPEGEPIEVTAPLTPYRASGVTLWRLLVLGGQAHTWSGDQKALRQLTLVPEHDRLTLRATLPGSLIDDCPTPATLPLAPFTQRRIQLGNREISMELLPPREGNPA